MITKTNPVTAIPGDGKLCSSTMLDGALNSDVTTAEFGLFRSLNMHLN